jgi:hypothetical protein
MAITNASKLADFASGASSTNTSVIQVDYTNRNVGVGTTNPTSKLTVQGDVLVSGVVTATTFSGNASSATYATNAGIATYATSSGVSTSVIGGIGSITQLTVSGISTFTNGPVLIGAATSTGTASQRLQVTGGTYVSDNLGVGTTNPTSKLHVVGDVLLSSVNSGPISGTRNRIINGSMVIDQRNAGVSTTFIAAAAAQYSVDRWYGYCTGANVTGQRITTVGVQTGGLYTYKFTGAASVTGIGFGQRIESYNSIDLAGSTATLAVDLSNSLLTGVGWTAYYANSTDTFGTLASPNKTSIASGTFTVGATTSRYSASISIPAAATTGIEVIFTVGAQTSGTWTISNVQLESGPVATPFERRSYGQELALCQRYFQKRDFTANGWITSATKSIGNIAFGTPFRASPSSATFNSGSISYGPGGNQSITSMDAPGTLVADYIEAGFNISGGMTTNAGSSIRANISISAEL